MSKHLKKNQQYYQEYLSQEDVYIIKMLILPNSCSIPGKHLLHKKFQVWEKTANNLSLWEEL